MNKLLKQLQQETKQIRLSGVEKSVMRTNLLGTMGVAPQIGATKSPYVRWFFMSRSFAFALVLVLLVGGGTAYAAEGSLPGDALYPIKIHVNEQVETALALSPKAKVAVNTKLAQRRIAEVEVLAARGVLDEATAEQAEIDFDYHAAQVVALTHQKNNKAHREDRAIFSAKISASLGVEDDVSTSTISAAASVREEKEYSTAVSAPYAKESTKQSAKENSDNFRQHVRTRVQTIIDLEVNNSTEESSADSEDRALHEQDDSSGRGE